MINIAELNISRIANQTTIYPHSNESSVGNDHFCTEPVSVHNPYQSRWGLDVYFCVSIEKRLIYRVSNILN